MSADNGLDLTECVLRVRRVLEHPYTSEVLELARMGRLISDLRESTVEPMAIAMRLGASLDFQRGVARLVRLGTLTEWIRRRRVSWLRARKVEREVVEVGDRSHHTRLVGKEGPKLRRTERMRLAKRRVGEQARRKAAERKAG